MKTKTYILAFLATTALLGATFSAVNADESTGTGVVTSTGVTNTGTVTGSGVSNTGTTNTGTVAGSGIIKEVRHEMRDARHEVRDMRHEKMSELKEKCEDLKKGTKKEKTECQVARKAMKEEIKTAADGIRKVLSEKTKTLFNTQLDKIPTSNKVALYTKVIAKLDVMLAQPRTEKVKNMLLELKSIVQARLDAVQSGISEQEIINEALAQ